MWGSWSGYVPCGVCDNSFRTEPRDLQRLDYRRDVDGCMVMQVTAETDESLWSRQSVQGLVWQNYLRVNNLVK